MRSHGTGAACYDQRLPEKCEACREAQRAYSARSRADKKAYQQANQARIKATARAYREAHLEERRAYSVTQREKARVRAKAYRLKRDEPTTARYRAANRAWRLRTLYGIGVEEYDAMLASQSGGCAICGRVPTGRPLHVDHHHIKGWKKMPAERRKQYVRGLLCYLCNRLLSKGITIAILRSAAGYLEAFDSRSQGERGEAVS